MTKPKKEVRGNAVPSKQQAAADQDSCLVDSSQPLIMASQPSAGPSVAAQLPERHNKDVTDGQSSCQLQTDADRVAVSSKLPSSRTSYVDNLQAVTAVSAADCVALDHCPVPVETKKTNTKLTDVVVPALSTDSGNHPMVGPAVEYFDQSKNADETEMDCSMEVCANESVHAASASELLATEDGQCGQKVCESPFTATSELSEVLDQTKDPGEDGTPLSSLCRHVAVTGKHCIQKNN